MTLMGTGEAPGREPNEAGRGAIPADTFAARLKLSRLHVGDITVKDAADRCGLNYGSWSNWERGSRPQELIEVAEAISAGLGIDRNWLLFGGPLATPESGGRRKTLRRKDNEEYPRRAGQSHPYSHTGPPTRRNRSRNRHATTQPTSPMTRGRNPISRPPGHPDSGLRTAA